MHRDDGSRVLAPRVRFRNPRAVYVLLSITTAMPGGVNSTGIDQAAAITLRRSPCFVLTRTVGPWLTRRLAWRSSTDCFTPRA